MTQTEAMKACKDCGEAKPLAAFRKHNNMKDGHINSCKVCVAAYNRSRYEEKRDALLAQSRAWNAANADRKKAIRRASEQRRRALTMTADEMPSNYWTALIRFYGAACLKCGSPDNLTLDHVVPLTKGGAHSLANAQILCADCNVRKNNRNSNDYRNRGNGILVDAVLVP